RELRHQHLFAQRHDRGQRHGGEEPGPAHLQSRDLGPAHRHAGGRLPLRLLERRHQHGVEPDHARHDRHPERHGHLRDQHLHPDQPLYEHRSKVELVAGANTGYHFVSWGGDASGTANPLTLTLDGNHPVTATFAINTYTLNVTTVRSGTVTKSPNQPTYLYGT